MTSRSRRRSSAARSARTATSATLSVEGRFDELWVSACSPNGLRELEGELSAARRTERLVVVVPSEPLPVERWTMEWARVRKAIELGRRDMEAAIEEVGSRPGPVIIGGAGLRQPLWNEK